jgi:hypothetical protein
MSKKEIKDIYNFIIEKYPIKNSSKIKNIPDIQKLRFSHFSIINSYDLTKSIDLKNISYVYVDSKWISKNKYKNFASQNMCYRDLDYFMKFPDYVPFFNLPNLQIKKLHNNDNDLIKINIIDTHIKKYKYKIPNHFIFNSLDISTNKHQLSRELIRLIKYRDNYKSLNFYLYGGGELIIATFILLSLCGKREQWMKKFKELDSYYYHENDITGEKTLMIKETDPWNFLESKNSYDYLRFRELIINNDKYSLKKNKYIGKIILNVNYLTTSAAWYLTTYLIYSFAKKIIRKTIKINGIFVKIGYVISNQIEIIGFSSTSSGDSLESPNKNNKIFKLFGKNFTIRAPTKFFLEDSIKKIDYNRFWIQNPKEFT